MNKNLFILALLLLKHLPIIQWYNWPYTGLNSLILDSENSEKIEKKLSIAF